MFIVLHLGTYSGIIQTIYGKVVYQNLLIVYWNTPFEYFKLFVDNDMIRNISEQTNLYSVEKCGKCVATSPEEIEQFLGIQM